MGLQNVHAGSVAAFDIPFAVNRNDHIEIFIVLDAIEKAPYALG